MHECEHAGLPVSRTLDRARVVARVAAPDNLVWQDDHLLFSSGRDVLVIDGVPAAPTAPEPILRFDEAVSALAAAPDGSLAVGLGGAGIRIVSGARDGLRIATLGGQTSIHPTALCFATPNVLFVCHGAAFPDGSVWRVDLAGGEAICLGTGLAFPNGLLLRDLGSRLVVSESGRRRLLALDATRPDVPRALCGDLPGDPGRLAPAHGEGAWLALSAPGDAALALRLDRRFKPLAVLRGAWQGVGSCLETPADLLLACRDSNVLIASDLLCGCA